jgi:hypothetical protein
MGTKDQAYRLTPKGLLGNYLDEDKRREVMDALELYMRRKNLGIMAHDGKLVFVEMEKVEG